MAIEDSKGMVASIGLGVGLAVLQCEKCGLNYGTALRQGYRYRPLCPPCAEASGEQVEQPIEGQEALRAGILALSALPNIGAGRRGGPRYVQMSSAKAYACSECHRTIPRGETHAYDRVRGFGKSPRRWCYQCWGRDPKPQVMR